eukprot:5625545-Amphidinium_carterae.1
MLADTAAWTTKSELRFADVSIEPRYNKKRTGPKPIPNQKMDAQICGERNKGHQGLNKNV